MLTSLLLVLRVYLVLYKTQNQSLAVAQGAYFKGESCYA